jgi:hypothetical protein
MAGYIPKILTLMNHRVASFIGNERNIFRSDHQLYDRIQWQGGNQSSFNDALANLDSSVVCINNAKHTL